MASVRMTRELRTKIYDKAVELYALANPKPQPSTEFVDLARLAFTTRPAQKTLKEIFNLAEQLKGLKSLKDGNPLVTETEFSTITLRLQDTDLERVIIEFPIAVKTLTTQERGYWDRNTVVISELAPEHRTKITELFNGFVARDKKYGDDAHEYQMSIGKLLDSCTTLKGLLEVWPAAENLIPQQAMQKLHEKVTRKQKAAALKEQIVFDDEAANRIVLTAKLMGG